VATRLAQHFALAGDWSRALDYLRSALRIANSRFAWRDALAVLDQAFALAANLSDTARIPAEIEFLERRAGIQAVAHDPQAAETYSELAAKAGQFRDVEAQCRALIGLAYAASWHDLAQSVRFLDEVLALCETLADPIQRDVTRMAAYARRLWQSGWKRADALECELALDRLEASGDSLTFARAKISFSMVCMFSTRYREVGALVEDGFRLLRESAQDMVEVELAGAVWMRHIGVPWSFMALGELGAGLERFAANIAAFEKADDPSAASYIQVYRGALLFYAMDFEGALRDCVPAAADCFERPAAPTTPTLPIKRRIALVHCGLAEAGLGNIAAALDALRAAEAEMARQPVHLDWYWRLALEWGMVGALIANGDHAAAHVRAARLCDLAAQTDERSWQALAWEARARAALACGEESEAMADVAKALAACDGVTVPLAEWRVHATSAKVHKAAGDVRQARAHGRLGAAVRRRLASTLPEGGPLRSTFERRSGALAAV